jgi:hypothetical protein
MYYWLKNDIEDEDFYVISDDSDDVYVVCEGMKPYKLKPTKHMFLKFKPYIELIMETETCPELDNL